MILDPKIVKKLSQNGQNIYENLTKSMFDKDIEHKSILEA